MSLLMDRNQSASGSLLSCPPKETDNDDHETKQPDVLVFDASLLQKQANLPAEFIWPHGDVGQNQNHDHDDDDDDGELKEPLVDLDGFLKGDETAVAHAAQLVRTACLNHGFFQVINHGVDPSLFRAAHEEIDTIFKLPLDKKLGIRRKPGSVCGYSGAHADRYSSKLPWKETFSFSYNYSWNQANSESPVVDYFKSVLGDNFERTGRTFEEYCEAMVRVSLLIFELLAISLGVDRLHYRQFFEDGSSIMRCNYYPPCKSSLLTLGTGPHCDPTSLTILHQDHVGGLQVFANNRWQVVRPQPHALVINIGDTFMALSNGIYKSCLHRAVASKDSGRRSLVFFVSPKEDKAVRPPQDLVCREVPRKYPDFTWSDLLEFTQKHYRADADTLQSFIQWLSSFKSI